MNLDFGFLGLNNSASRLNQQSSSVMRYKKIFFRKIQEIFRLWFLFVWRLRLEIGLGRSIFHYCHCNQNDLYPSPKYTPPCFHFIYLVLKAFYILLVSKWWVGNQNNSKINLRSFFQYFFCYCFALLPFPSHFMVWISSITRFLNNFLFVFYDNFATEVLTTLLHPK